jgi:hypothetical protein
MTSLKEAQELTTSTVETGLMLSLTTNQETATSSKTIVRQVS